jgi:hypothetical protein
MFGSLHKILSHPAHILLIPEQTVTEALESLVLQYPRYRDQEELLYSIIAWDWCGFPETILAELALPVRFTDKSIDLQQRLDARVAAFFHDALTRDPQL